MSGEKDFTADENGTITGYTVPKPTKFWNKLMILSFAVFCGCSNNEWRQLRNGDIISPEGVKYIFLADIRDHKIFDNPSFISHINGYPRERRFWRVGNLDKSVFSLGNTPDMIILNRKRYDHSEWSDLYIKKTSLKNNFSFENSSLFKFFTTKSAFDEYRPDNDKIEIRNFYNEAVNDSAFFSSGDIRIGYIYGFHDDIPDIAFPGEVWRKNDGRYFLLIGKDIFGISMESLNKLGYDE